ncbi:MAG: GTP-binding protein [Rhizobiales bacterium]|nr:GTP-binding protein [Hyphomicrobiales bacterium]MBA71007.1 GTP-binding protein [Hyphomicrobiales bacterium]
MSGPVPSPGRLPVHAVTGFLGAGKTTLLNRFIATPFLSEAALIINEFGDIGIDHLLVEQSGEGVIELSDGCLCCTLRGDLVDTLADLMDRRQTGKIKAFNRVIVETTGLADPGPVIQAVIGHPVLAQCYRFDGLITVVDAINGLSTLDHHEEARRQVALADRLVVSKGDAVEGATRAELATRLAALNPRVAVIDAGDPDLTPEGVFECGAWDPVRRQIDANAWLGAEHGHGEHDHHHDHSEHDHDHADGHHHHHDGVLSESLELNEAISPQALTMFLDLMRSAHGPKLLRMKGLIKLADDPSRPVVVHAVQSVVAEPVRLKSWPAGSGEKTRLVVITRDMPEGFVADLFGAFADQPAVGRPDSAALTNNPLRVPGGYKP